MFDTPYGGLPYGAFDIAYSESVAATTDSLLLNTHKQRSWLARIKPRDASTDTNPITVLNLDLSSDGHNSLLTDDDVISYTEALIIPYSLSYDLSGLWGMVSAGEGELVIGDGRGDLRSWTDEDFIGRQCDIYLGPRRGSQAQFARVARLSTRNHTYDRTSLSLILDDYSHVFDVPIQTERYRGTGGLTGDSEIAGLLHPLVIGKVRQIEPVLVESSTNTYQVSGGIESVSNVEMNGSAVTFNTDVADITASTPPANTYNTSLATGHLKFGTTPTGVITCDVEGHNTSTYGYVETISPIVKLLAVEFAGLNDPDELDKAAFDQMETDRTALMGFYISGRSTRSTTQITSYTEYAAWLLSQKVKPSPAAALEASPTIASIMSFFLQCDAAYAWMKPNKELTIGRITDPDSATADISLDADESDVLGWVSEGFETPCYQVIVGYRFYARTLSFDEQTGSFTVDTYDRGEEYRYIEATDDDVLTQTPQAKTITVLTNLDSSADALSLGNSILDLRKILRRRVTVQPRVGLLKYGIGNVVELTDTALNSSPKNMTIIGVSNQAAAADNNDVIEWRCYS